MRAFKDEAIEKIRKQVGKGRVICGLSGGVDSAVAAVLDSRGDRRPVDLRVCRSRAHAARRSAESHDDVPQQLQHPAGACGCVGNIPESARGRLTIPSRNAKRSENCSSTSSRLKRKKIGGAGVPCARHALSGRDRKRFVHRRPIGDHQVTPQCRRLARAHVHEAGRAAA